MVYITRKETFSAAHKLSRPDWSNEKNAEVFGKCSNPNWHGHNYQLWVTVKGEINPETGFVANLAEISVLLKKFVLDKIDHKNLDMDVDFMRGKFSSTEVLAVEIWKQLEGPVRELGCLLHSIKIQETDKNSVEYFGN
ncbi:MAG TPA: 6-carboxytetrahydropterin synthase [Bacteroidia bacterium]|nr:6-carboxytetrahydropterin synthase [Bacteroidia bacterium]HNP99302.1 6-carboxytetrahydropterin synthase [Bacteroidia bacterium]